YEVDRTAGANPIRQQLDNLNEAGSLYGAIIYQKAPIVMRHLEAILGEESFRDGLREYLEAHKFANATWNDLITVLDRRTPQDLRAWSRVWVEEPGRPTITTRVETSDGRITQLAFEQSDPLGRQRVWPQELRVYAELPGDSAATNGGYREATQSVSLSGATATLPAAAGATIPNRVQTPGGTAPILVLPSADGWGYGDFVLDSSSLSRLQERLPELGTPLLRGSGWVTLWDTLLDGRVAPAAFFDLTTRALPLETDEQLTARILNYGGTTWWRFLSASERQERASSYEALLRAGLARATTASQKAAWFGTLRTVATTPTAVDYLRRVWAKEEPVSGLPLAEADYTALALELAVREVDGWQKILTDQLARIENPDRKGRFNFVMPALSADPAERDRWFRSLADVNNRRREPWVLEGLNYLHHPLRARASTGYVAPSLDMLWEIQKTGDIFFPKRWLDAILGGHNSAEVAGIVRQFLSSLPPGYPERLRMITLQSADELFRASRR
ncbi:MAG: ERAP1-like C-terminal domain-containing protein, partial [Acidobacteria bacterium]|nr:ERAP1-like C-terminal domain-containing protein [Acidobacteriota bacterium]